LANRSLHFVAAAFVVGISNLPATADETGIASIHAWENVGRLTCIKGHWHYGTATASTRKVAAKKAILNWINFTAFDYGSDWMSYRRAKSKALKCERVGTGWACSAEGRACKLRKRARQVKRK
jgi:hypothetical protein